MQNGEKPVAKVPPIPSPSTPVGVLPRTATPQDPDCDEIYDDGSSTEVDCLLRRPDPT